MLKIVQDLLREGHQRRPGTIIRPTSITIHNTGNPTSPARNERAWLDNPANLSRPSNQWASWHYVLDQNEVIQAIPDNEMSFHAGAKANRSSIGVEICESGDRAVVWRNTIVFIAQLLKRYGWGVQQLTTHQAWTGKACPRLLLPRWSEFIAAIQQELDKNVEGDDDVVVVNKVKIEMQGVTREFDSITHEGRTFVQVRPVLENLDYTVSWSDARKAIIINKSKTIATVVSEEWKK